MAAWSGVLCTACAGVAAGPLVARVVTAELGRHLALWCRLALGAAVAGAWVVIETRVVLRPALFAYLLLTLCLVVLSAVDLGARRVPNRVVLPALAAVSAGLIMASGASGRWDAVAGAAVGGCGSAGALWLVRRISPGLGLGDVRLAALTGAATGWVAPLREVVLLPTAALLLACALGLAFGTGRVVVAWLRGPGRPLGDRRFAFAPFLSVATVWAIGWGAPTVAAVADRLH